MDVSTNRRRSSSSLASFSSAMRRLYAAFRAAADRSSERRTRGSCLSQLTPQRHRGRTLAGVRIGGSALPVASCTAGRLPRSLVETLARPLRHHCDQSPGGRGAAPSAIISASSTRHMSPADSWAHRVVIKTTPHERGQLVANHIGGLRESVGLRGLDRNRRRDHPWAVVRCDVRHDDLHLGVDRIPRDNENTMAQLFAVRLRNTCVVDLAAADCYVAVCQRAPASTALASAKSSESFSASAAYRSAHRSSLRRRSEASRKPATSSCTIPVRPSASAMREASARAS